MPLVLRTMRSRPGLIERGRKVGADLAWLLTRRYSFGSSDVSPALVDYVEQLIAGTPVDVVADFFPALTAHDKLGSLSRLAGVEIAHRGRRQGPAHPGGPQPADGRSCCRTPSCSCSRAPGTWR